MAPVGIEGTDQLAATGLEALVLTKGIIEIEVDGSETTTASAGQSLIFTTRRAHAYRNTSSGVAELLSTAFDPIDDGTIR